MIEEHELDQYVPLKDGRVVEMLSTGVYWSQAFACYVFVNYDAPGVSWHTESREQCRLVRGPFGEGGLDGMRACACNCALDTDAPDGLALVGYDPERENPEDEITYSEVLWDSASGDPCPPAIEAYKEAVYVINWRRERATRVWQAVQCWIALLESHERCQE